MEINQYRHIHIVHLEGSVYTVNLCLRALLGIEGACGDGELGRGLIIHFGSCYESYTGFGIVVVRHRGDIDTSLGLKTPTAYSLLGIYTYR